MPKDENCLAWEKVAFLLQRRNEYEFNTKTDEIVLPNSGSSKRERIKILDLTHKNLQLLVKHYSKNNTKPEHEGERESHAYHDERRHSYAHSRKHHRGHPYANDRERSGIEHGRSPNETHAIDFAINHPRSTGRIVGHTQQDDNKKRLEERVARYVSLFLRFSPRFMRSTWNKNKQEKADCISFALKYGNAETVISIINDSPDLLNANSEEGQRAIKTIVESNSISYLVTLLNACRNITPNSIGKLYTSSILGEMLINKILLKANRADMLTFLNLYNDKPINCHGYEGLIQGIIKRRTFKEVISLFKVFKISSYYPGISDIISDIIRKGDVKLILSLAKYPKSNMSDKKYRPQIRNLLRTAYIEDALELVKLCKPQLTWTLDSELIKEVMNRGTPEEISIMLKGSQGVKLKWSENSNMIKRVLETGTIAEISTVLSYGVNLPITTHNYPKQISQLLQTSQINIHFLFKGCPGVILDPKLHSSSIDTLLSSATANTIASIITSNEHNHRLIFNLISTGCKRTGLMNWRKKLNGMINPVEKHAIIRLFTALDSGIFTPFADKGAHSLEAHYRSSPALELPRSNSTSTMVNYYQAPLSAEQFCANPEIDTCNNYQENLFHGESFPDLMTTTANTEAAKIIPTTEDINFSERLSNSSKYYFANTLENDTTDTKENAHSSFPSSSHGYESADDSFRSESPPLCHRYASTDDSSSCTGTDDSSSRSPSLSLSSSYAGTNDRWSRSPSPSSSSSYTSTNDSSSRSPSPSSSSSYAGTNDRWSRSPSPSSSSNYNSTSVLGSKYMQKPLQSKQEASNEARYTPYSQSNKGILSITHNNPSRLIATVSPMPQAETGAKRRRNTTQAPSSSQQARL